MPSSWQHSAKSHDNVTAMESYAHLATPDVHVAELDPTNFPPPEADSKLLELWNLHGHLYSYR